VIEETQGEGLGPLRLLNHDREREREREREYFYLICSEINSVVKIYSGHLTGPFDTRKSV
jgi:hypothetical protein